MDLSQIAIFIVYLGTPAALNWIVSKLLDNWPRWNKLEPETKSTLIFLLSLVLGIGSYEAKILIPPESLAKVQDIYFVIYGIVTAWLSGQIQHERFKAALRKGQHSRIAAVRVKALHTVRGVPSTRRHS